MYKYPEYRYGSPSPIYRFMTDVEPTSTSWLWPQRVPLGCLTLLIGDPGVGKSLLAIDMAARVSAARPWPDDPPCEHSIMHRPVEELLDFRGIWARRIPRLLGTVFASPEDADALPARLAAANAEPFNISILDGVRVPDCEDPLPFRLPVHVDQLAQAIRAHDRARLVVLDPLHLLLDDGVHSCPGFQAELLARLAGLARRYRVALLAVGHFTKTPARRALYRIRGTLSLTAAARSILLVTQDPEDGERRILTQVKNSYARVAPPLAFRLVDGPRIEWVAADARDWRLGTGELDLSDEGMGALSEACGWLADFLQNGSVSASKCFAAGREAGLSARTLKRAKRVLAVRSVREGDGWVWTLDQGGQGGQD
jgi:putative DNA primase/helicase